MTAHSSPRYKKCILTYLWLGVAVAHTHRILSHLQLPSQINSKYSPRLHLYARIHVYDRHGASRLSNTGETDNREGRRERREDDIVGDSGLMTKWSDWCLHNGFDNVSDSKGYRVYREVPKFDFFVSACSDESLAVRAHCEGPESPFVSLQVHYKSTRCCVYYLRGKGLDKKGGGGREIEG